MQFHKYSALGNDYLVVTSSAPEDRLSVLAQRLCERHTGIGADGLLVRHAPQSKGNFAVRIFNPDGSEAEKSGNGLRIFARFLWDLEQVGSTQFAVETKGGHVSCQILDDGRRIRVEMGTASFSSDRIPVAGPLREVINEKVRVGDSVIAFTGVTIGNPHCVVVQSSSSAEIARQLGPLLEKHPLFPQRVNVQFVRVDNEQCISMHIWERGVGYTLASGSSSCAAAAACVKLGLCSFGDIAVSMPGGVLTINIDASFKITMTGPVAAIASGLIASELISGLQ